ncbi:Hypothetical predicted protein [Pelobates cultripes]|uniref:Uncharacterized protein n=1 Tax=Pelobates cultripes TaxID=61616 RepID=A0AAD1S1Y6_PELCU|nr:Hypothetical predicted protein [Pelobates cultripes]
MANSKVKKSATKAEKMSFFGQKTQSANETARASIQDGADDSDTTMLQTTSETLQPAEYLTRGYFEQSMTTSVEQQYEELTSTQGYMSRQLHALQHQMEHMEARVADQEDRARRNNLRLRGVPETVLP